MGWYIARRLLQVIPVLLGVSFVVFLLMFLVPGDAALLMLGPEGTLEDLARLRHELLIGQPRARRRSRVRNTAVPFMLGDHNMWRRRTVWR